MRKECVTIEEAQALTESLHDEKKYIIEVLQLAAGGYAVQWQEHKMYTSLDGKSWPDEVWRTEDGRILQIQDIEPEHCRNILRMILRQEREAEEHLKELTGILKNAIETVRSEIEEGYEDPVDGALVPATKPVVH